MQEPQEYRVTVWDPGIFLPGRRGALVNVLFMYTPSRYNRSTPSIPHLVSRLLFDSRGLSTRAVPKGYMLGSNCPLTAEYRMRVPDSVRAPWNRIRASFYSLVQGTFYEQEFCIPFRWQQFADSTNPETKVQGQHVLQEKTQAMLADG